MTFRCLCSRNHYVDRKHFEDLPAGSRSLNCIRRSSCLHIGRRGGIYTARELHLRRQVLWQKGTSQLDGSVKMLSLRNNMTRLSKSGEIARVSNSDHISITLCNIKGGSAVAHLKLLACNSSISGYRTGLTRVHKLKESADSRTYGTRVLCDWSRSIIQ